MENSNIARRTVLIVDDDEDLLILIQHALSVEGFDPICSPNGVNIMSIVTRKHPDIVLLDIHMNGTDGVTICKELKRNPETASTPIIMFSANDNIKAISLEGGADGYITKPFKTDDFRETLRRVLLQRQSIHPPL
jgi:two-component system, OmpR family, alkaline phosphatase synthesis response regulator PhoP